VRTTFVVVVLSDAPAVCSSYQAATATSTTAAMVKVLNSFVFIRLKISSAVDRVAP